ncbi:MAG: bifunctional metallophosphatase/5'-nucleotidase [Armatimonadota bacterium]|nr:bifunctional metallophosphatase/5'-nucleotidase [Armatimonadota bacterium]
MSDTGLTIVQLNDSHGYLDQHLECFRAQDGLRYAPAGGFSRIKRIVDGIRQETGGNTLFLDCGDTIHGTYAAVQSRGEAVIPIANELGLEAWTAHWEFAWGPERLKEIAALMDHPLLAINCYDEETDERVFEPWIVREVAGLRLGIIGIAATIVDKTMPDQFSEGIYLTVGGEEVRIGIEALRGDEDCDLILVISHLGFPQDAKLAATVEGIDVLVSGHTHNRMFRPHVVNDTIIFQSGCHGSFLGRLDLTVRDGEIAGFDHELIVVDERIEPDWELQGLVRTVEEPDAEMLAEIVGETRIGLPRVRATESTMDNLLLDGLLHATGAQMAFSNGWRYGAPIAPGPITLGDLWNIIPVNPPVSTCTLTGAELREMLEENLHRTFAADPWEQMGGYIKRCAGLTCYFKAENPEGARIQELFVEGRHVRDDDEFDVAFVTTQGVPAKYGWDREDLDLRAIDALRDHLAEASPVEPALQGAFVAV